MTDIPALRASLGLSQAQFAARYGLSLGTLHHWEIGRRSPSGAAAVLLRLIEREPETIARILADVLRHPAAP